MILISWNIMAGGGSRVASQIKAIKRYDPDIVAFQEVTSNSVPVYRDYLCSIGLNYSIDSFQFIKRPSSLKGPRRYGELIASRWHIEHLPKFLTIPWNEKALSCIAKAPIGDIQLHNVHVPNGSANDWIKIRTLEGVYKGLACNVDYRRILCGDFNTPQDELTDERIVTWGQYEKGNHDYALYKYWGKRWDRGERNVLEDLSSFDLPEVYRSLYGFIKMDYSWYAKRKGNRVGRRFDHVFASSNLSPVECTYLHELRTKKLSDHSAVKVVFNPN